MQEEAVTRLDKRLQELKGSEDSYPISVSERGQK
jgi:hypothetical protein